MIVTILGSGCKKCVALAQSAAVGAQAGAVDVLLPFPLGWNLVALSNGA